MLWIFDKLDGCAAYFREVKAAEIGCHADRNAGIRGHENVRVGRRQQRRLLHLAVIVIHKIHRVGVDIAEQLGTERIQLGLGITRRGVCHIARVHLAEVALAVHKRHEKRLIAACQAHHGLVDSRIAMRVQLHGLTHDVRGFGAVAVQQAHLVHGVQQLAVGRLEAVNLRDRAGHDNAHRVRHVVLAQRVRDALIDRRVFFIYFWFVGFLFCHYALLCRIFFLRFAPPRYSPNGR